VELEAIQGDILTEIPRYMEDLNRTVVSTINVLDDNMKRESVQGDAILDRFVNLSNENYCPDCARAGMSKTYNLANIIHDRFERYMEQLASQDLRQGINDRIRSKVRVSLPDEMMFSLTSCIPLSPIAGERSCPTHGPLASNVLRLRSFTSSIAHTGDAVFGEIEEPVRKRIVETSHVLGQVLQAKRSQVLQTLPYEQLTVELELERVKSMGDRMEAQRVLEVSS
jgi:hypothetical protein